MKKYRHKKISEMERLEALGGEELIPCVSGGKNKAMEAGLIKAAVLDDLADLSDKNELIEALAQYFLRTGIEMRWFNSGHSIGIFDRLGKEVAKVSNVARYTDIEEPRKFIDLGTVQLPEVIWDKEWSATFDADSTQYATLRNLVDALKPTAKYPEHFGHDPSYNIKALFNVTLTKAGSWQPIDAKYISTQIFNVKCTQKSDEYTVSLYLFDFDEDGSLKEVYYRIVLNETDETATIYSPGLYTYDLSKFATRTELAAGLANKADRSELSNIVGVPTEGVLEDLEPTLVSEALRKVPQVLTDEERAQVKANLGISKLELFVDLWNTACGTYGKYDLVNAPDPEHPFYLNTLWLTYEEALVVFEKSMWRSNSIPAIDYTYAKTNIFNMSLADSFDRAYNMGGFDLMRLVRANQNVEVLRVSIDDNDAIIGGEYGYGITVKSIDGMFYTGTHNAFKKVLGAFDLRLVSTPWKLCDGSLPNLTTLLLTRAKCSFDMSCAPKISLDSINYWITHAINAAPITITLHPDAYARLTDSLIASASAKNITFATV